MELLDNSTFLLLREMKAYFHTKTCIQMCIIHNSWKVGQHKCLSINEEIKCVLAIQWSIV
jgi:hypothetical protein